MGHSRQLPLAKTRGWIDVVAAIAGGEEAGVVAALAARAANKKKSGWAPNRASTAGL